MTFLQRVARRMGEGRFLRLLGSLYPPYLGAGIRVVEVSEDLSRLEVELRYSFWNRNFLGTQFGGSLYSMCDPFFLLLVLMRLGDAYVVWDKSATIEFLKPGRGPARALFELPDARLAELRAEVEAHGKINPVFEVMVRDQQQEPIARVTKTLSIRRKPAGH